MAEQALECLFKLFLGAQIEELSHGLSGASPLFTYRYERLHLEQYGYSRTGYNQTFRAVHSLDLASSWTRGTAPIILGAL